MEIYLSGFRTLALGSDPAGPAFVSNVGSPIVTDWSLTTPVYIYAFARAGLDSDSAPLGTTQITAKPSPKGVSH